MLLLSLWVPSAAALDASVSNWNDFQYLIAKCVLSPEDDIVHLDADLVGPGVLIMAPLGTLTIEGNHHVLPPLQISDATVTVNDAVWNSANTLEIPLLYRLPYREISVTSGLWVYHSTLSLSSVVFEGGDWMGVVSFGSDISLEDTDATGFKKVFFEGFQNLSQHRANTVWVSGGTYSLNGAGVFEFWGDTHEPVVTIQNVKFENNTGLGGSDVEGHDIDLHVEGSSFTNSIAKTDASAYGAPISTRISNVSLIGDTFTNPDCKDGLALAAHLEGDVVSIENLYLLPETDRYYPFLLVEANAIEGGSASVTDVHYDASGTTVVPRLLDFKNLTTSSFKNSHLDFAGTHLDSILIHSEAVATTQMQIEHVQICNAGIDGENQSYALIDTTHTDLTLNRNVFSNLYTKSILEGDYLDNYTVYNNTFWGVVTTGDTGSGIDPIGMVSGIPDSLWFYNNLVAAGNSAVWLDDRVKSGEVGYNFWYDVDTPLDGSSPIYQNTNFEDDPQISNYDPTDCINSPIPSSKSPLVDAGKPGTYDPDGLSAADIGAFPAIDTGASDDTGPDDTNASDDTGATVDADGDGIPSTLDCDDANPSVSPATTEIPNDGVDQDCNGSDTTSTLEGGVNCACAEGRAPLAWAWMGLLAIGRRRR